MSSPVVFVTGVTGQDGSHMVDYLLKNTEATIIGGARRLSVENHANLKHLANEPRFLLVNFDLTDSHSVYGLVEAVRPDYFINFAAQSFVASSWDFALQTWEVNSTGVLHCFEAIRRFKKDCRFYNAGSSEEFGNIIYTPQDEKHPLRPRSPYGASKAAARQLVKVYRESYGLYAVQGWLFNHEGPRRGEEFVTRKITKGVAEIYKHLLAQKPTKDLVPIELGNINAKRDWSDAEDCVDAVWRMLNQDSTKIKDYVVSSGTTHSIREFVEAAFKAANIKGGWENGEQGELDEKYVGDKNKSVLVKINPKFYRPAEIEVLRGDPSLIISELGWCPKVDFAGLVKKMVENDLRKV